ncbi:MAG: ABC transporter substrate-binding protein [Proteobacteria bacterium]|nr:ABC transporter substrate-binding protein [Pseudomonadota bacterium]
MRYLLVLTLIFQLFTTPVFADDKDDVSSLVNNKINLVMDLLRDSSLTKVSRNDKVVAALTPVIDFSRMAKISLGKKYWKSINKAQRKEYSKLFIKQIQESLLEKLELYTDEKLVFKKVTSKKKKIYVLLELVSQDSKIDLLFKFYKSKKGGWKSYDVEILGVSMIQTYRTQFASLFKKGGIDLLLEKMRQSGQFIIDTDAKK